jgi:hypothetical protein
MYVYGCKAPNFQICAILLSQVEALQLQCMTFSAKLAQLPLEGKIMEV